MSVNKLDELRLRADELMHRNQKQKDELMSDVKDFLISKMYPRNVMDTFNLIVFDYNEIHQLNNGKKDEQWKKGKASLKRLLEKM